MSIRIQIASLLFFVVSSLLWGDLLAQENKAGKNDGAKTQDPAILTIDRIYNSDEFKSKGFSGQWQVEGHEYLLQEEGIVSVNAQTDERTELIPKELFVPDAESPALKVESYSFSDDESLLLIYTNSKRVWRRRSRGDYWILDRSSRTLRKLAEFAKASTTQFAKISPDSKKVAYVVEGNIFVEDVRSGDVRQLTEKRTDKIINGTFDWVYEEEFGLRDGFRWSPDSQLIAFWQLDTTGVPVFTMVNNTDSMYPKLIQFAHPKTGQRNSACRIGVKNITWQKSDEQTQWIELDGDPRENYVARMDWTKEPNKLVLQQLNRLQNTNQVIRYNTSNGNQEVLLAEKDDCWVDTKDDLHWLADGESFTWTSERDGWQHIYIVSNGGKDARLITPSNFDVMSLDKVDERAGVVYFTASPDNASQRYLFSAAMDGSSMKRITPKDFVGSHTYQISGDGKFAVHTYSAAGVPPTVDLVSLPDHKVVREIESNEVLKKNFEELDQQAVEFLKIETHDGDDQVVMDAWCMKPPNMKAGEKYPLLIYVYGEPAGSTTGDRWGGSSYLWHLMLAQKGYIVMSIDNRGTKVARGREWRKSIYRNVGTIASRDQAAALKTLLKERTYIDPDRVGIWGWSGGGSMSLNAIFRYPELYKTAISVAPVPNQRYYDTIYQERYMGLPSDNAQGYFDGSPINFAKRLKGNLLLVHGTGDDNCHYQTMEMLINELIRHNKQFSMMAYPNRSHSIREGKNTTRHLRELMTRYVLDNL